jgi:hypothetical protein
VSSEGAATALLGCRAFCPASTADVTSGIPCARSKTEPEDQSSCDQAPSRRKRQHQAAASIHDSYRFSRSPLVDAEPVQARGALVVGKQIVAKVFLVLSLLRTGVGVSAELCVPLSI